MFVKVDFGYRYTVRFITREFWSSKANWGLRFLLPSITLADFLGNRSLLQRVQLKASLEQFYIFNYAAEGQQEQVMVCDLWLVDFDPFNMCVPVLQGSLHVIVIMIGRQWKT